MGGVEDTAILEMLEGLSFVQAVLWIASRLANGLAHAHYREILHRDLKPANVLLTDEGQPMLLDFSVAEDIKRRSPPSIEQIGGTVCYTLTLHLPFSPAELGAIALPARKLPFSRKWKDQIVEFSLSASVGTSTVAAAVRMTIYDQNNNAVFTSLAFGGQPLSTGFAFRAAGNHTLPPPHRRLRRPLRPSARLPRRPLPPQQPRPVARHRRRHQLRPPRSKLYPRRGLIACGSLQRRTRIWPHETAYSPGRCQPRD